MDDRPPWNLLDSTDWRSLVERRLAILALPRGGSALEPDLVGPLGEALRLDPEAQAHFAALVDLERASPHTRRRAFAALQRTQRGRASADLREEALLARTRWTVRAIAALADLDAFRMDPVWIGAVSIPPIHEDDAQEALIVLLRLGVLQMDEAGALFADLRALGDEAEPTVRDPLEEAPTGPELDPDTIV